MFSPIHTTTMSLLLALILSLAPLPTSAAGQLIRHTPINGDGRQHCTILSPSSPPNSPPPSPNSSSLSTTTTSTDDDDDDTALLAAAFTHCSTNSIITLPSSTHLTLTTRLTARLHHVTIRWAGTLALLPDPAHWRQRDMTYPISFQNHAAAFVISGEGITIEGEGTGGIDGGGEAWYAEEKGETRPGRPMPFVFWNVTDVTVRDFSVQQPALWAINVMNGTDMVFENMTVNATASTAPWGSNWVQNTDGFDTMDATNITLHRLTYRGGDDCVAIKPRSSHITLSNLYCRGGNGVAIGSLGQYAGIDASVSHVRFHNVTVERVNDDLHNSAYIKTWIGEPTLQDFYESGGVPRGGGVGVVEDVLFEGFCVRGADAGPAVTQDSGNDAKGTFAGTSRMEVRDVRFVGWRGWLREGVGEEASISCSRLRPCRGVVLGDVELTDGEGGERLVGGECRWVGEGGVEGLNGTGCS